MYVYLLALREDMDLCKNVEINEYVAWLIPQNFLVVKRSQRISLTTSPPSVN
jgi:hypothetical protein